jgi:hypothetical protein
MGVIHEAHCDAYLEVNGNKAKIGHDPSKYGSAKALGKSANQSILCNMTKNGIMID